MKKSITILLFVLCANLAYTQTEDIYHILYPQKNRNTGKTLTSMLLKETEHKQLGKVLVVSTQKNSIGISFLFDKKHSEKAKRKIFYYGSSYIVEYNEESFMSFNIKGVLPDGKLKIEGPNYYTKNKSSLKDIGKNTIQAYAQKIYELTK